MIDHTYCSEMAEARCRRDCRLLRLFQTRPASIEFQISPSRRAGQAMVSDLNRFLRRMAKAS